MGRIDRVNEQMKREISSMLQFQIQDPRLVFVTITGVNVSKDLQHAKVSFSVLGSEKQRASAQEGLDGARGFVRRLIGQKIRLRYTPEIEFVYDGSIEYGARIEQALQTIRDEHDQHPQDPRKVQ